jgi:hypothetical protein
MLLRAFNVPLQANALTFPMFYVEHFEEMVKDLAKHMRIDRKNMRRREHPGFDALSDMASNTFMPKLYNLGIIAHREIEKSKPNTNPHLQMLTTLAILCHEMYDKNVPDANVVEAIEHALSEIRRFIDSDSN